MPPRPANVIIVAVDSLRADHVSCYGYRRLTTPHIDRLAANGVVFENAFSPYIPTTPAFSTMLTGRDVMATGVVSLTPKQPLNPDVSTLPEMLRQSGYVSACIGFEDDYLRGFDRYANYDAWFAWQERPARKAENLHDVALLVLEELAGQPFLLLLRYMDPHTPYLPPPPFDRIFHSSDEFDPKHRSMEPVFALEAFSEFFRSWMPPGVTDTEYIVAQYDGAVAYMDACFSRLLVRLEELGLADQTVLVVTSDHGETLTEHDCYFDHHGLYEATLRVPLIFHLPAGAGARVAPGLRLRQNALLEDIVPTLLDLLGLSRLRKQVTFDGHSLLPLMRGENRKLHSQFYLTECTWMRKRGWRTPHWKLIAALEPDLHGKPPVELYNLVQDPQEVHNLADHEPAVAQQLQRAMARWIERRLGETGREDPILSYQVGLNKRMSSILSAKRKTSDFLESLGYV